MLTEEEKLGLAAYILTSKYRIKVLHVLKEHDFMTPKYIALHCSILQNHISKTLKELKNKELVECINPEAKKGRLYRLTPLGGEIYEKSLELQGKSVGELNDWGILAGTRK